MTAHSPLRCANSGMARLPTASQKLVLMDVGSYPGASNYLNQTWTWNGTDWSNQSPSNFSGVDPGGPLPGRINHVMSYDGTNIMLYGGQGANKIDGALQDTWTWNGTTWTKQNPANPPFGRYLAEVCNLTVSSGQVIMFGGFGGAGNGQVITETWSWNGGTKVWSLLSAGGTAATPAGRVGHVMDGGLASLIMFGGSSSNNQLFNDTWSFNGTTWTQLFPATSPSVRWGASMAYDQIHNVWVMFGGMNYATRLNETWIYNGVTWVQQSPAASPAGLTWSQMCFDHHTNTVLLFGGFSSTDNYASQQTWSWTGINWVQL